MISNISNVEILLRLAAAAALGSLVGFAWAFATGFVLCGLAAWIYNGLVALRHGPR